MLKSKRKAPIADFIDGDDEPTEPLKKRAKGRPKGSKNKPKEIPVPVEKPKQTLRERAEAAAYAEGETETCNICLFRFDDPIKKEKALTRCTDCNTLVHEPCLVKSGCLSDLCFI